MKFNQCSLLQHCWLYLYRKVSTNEILLPTKVFGRCTVTKLLFFYIRKVYKMCPPVSWHSTNGENRFKFQWNIQNFNF